MSVGHTLTPFVTIYEINSATDTFTKIANPATLPAGLSQAVEFSPSGQYMSVAHNTSPFVTIYEINSATDTFTKIANPASLPTSNGWGVAFSPSGQYLSVVHLSTPFVTIYEINSATDTFTKIADPASLPVSSSSTIEVGFSPSGQYMSIVHDTTPFVTIYEVDSATDTFTKLANPASLPASTGNDVAFSPSGQYMSVAHVTSPFVTIYETNKSISLLGNPIKEENTAPILEERNLPLRLRLLIGNQSKSIPYGTTDLKLQYSAKFGTCDTGFVGESYTDVLDASSNFSWLNNLYASTDISRRNTDPANNRSNVPIGYFQDAPIVNKNLIPYNTNGLLDLGINDSTTSVGSYCFRIVKSTGQVLDAYNYIAELTTLPANNEFLRHGRAIEQNGQTLPFFWGRNRN
jgi:hypothetical protein